MSKSYILYRLLISVLIFYIIRKCEVKPSYQMAWRTLKNIKSVGEKDRKESFKFIQDFLRRISGANSGTIYSFSRDEENNFERAFLCLSSSAAAFPYTRKVIVIDGCHLKTGFGGVALAACVQDGVGEIVPLAVAIVSHEDESNWRFFLTQLVNAIPDIQQRGQVIMSDRDKGLSAAIPVVLPLAHPSSCVAHIERNVVHIFKSNFNKLIWRAAKSYLNDDFEETMGKIASKNREAEHYLRNTPPSTWAISQYPVRRFGIITSNSAESLNSWISDLRGCSHFEFFYQLCVKSRWDFI